MLKLFKKFTFKRSTLKHRLPANYKWKGTLGRNQTIFRLEDKKRKKDETKFGK